MEIILKTSQTLDDQAQNNNITNSIVASTSQLNLVENSSKYATNQSLQVMIPFMDLFRFAHTKDIVLMVLGIICASALGASYPIFSFLWGDMIDSLASVDADIIGESRKILIQFVYLGIGACIVGWGMFTSWRIAGSRQASECRKQYLKQLMKQQIQWFDLSNQSQLASQFAADCTSFQLAVSQKISTLIMILAMFIAGLILAMVKGWMMALVVLGLLPFLIIACTILLKIHSSKNSVEQEAYLRASSKMQETISSIKTVKQLNGEQHESSIYDDMLKVAVRKMQQYAKKSALALGFSQFFLLLCFILSFWYGSACVQGTSFCPSYLNVGGKTYTAGNVMTIFFCLLLPALNFSNLTPSIRKIMQGRAAAFRIYNIIDREPTIKSPLQPLIPETFKGIFKFQRVTFAYPKDKTKEVLQRFSCEINTANSGLVGKSGCGKSTVFQLMMRFYDPDSGNIALDGHDLRMLDLAWLRRQIGYVGQEPVLFATSIKQNLRMSRPQATDEEIIAALKQAEAYDFVKKFPEKLQTYVGSGGSQISGGQKQRLAIARALLKNPKILLLDEATSSLDRKNQKLIQNTLNKIANDMRIITISHSITTILRCQNILVIKQGKVDQQGTYQSLIYFKECQKSDEIGQVGKQYNNFIKEEQDLQNYKSTTLFLNTQTKQEGQQTLHPFLLEIQPSSFVPQSSIIPSELAVDLQTSSQAPSLDNENQSQGTFVRIFSYAKNYKCELFFGIVASILVGFTFPVFNIYFGKILANQLLFPLDPAQSRSNINQYSYIQLGIMTAHLIIVFFQQMLLITIGSKITQQIRSEVFLKIVKMPIPWFQCKKNLSGQLTARIFTDFKHINAFASDILRSTIFIISCFIVGIVMALFYQWRIALTSVGLLPLLAVSGVLQLAVSGGFNEGKAKTTDISCQIVSESISSIRTILTLGDQAIIERYSKALNSNYDSMVRKSNIAGLFFGLSFMILFITIALIFYLVSVYTQQNKLDVQNVLSSTFIVLFVGITTAGAINDIPDMQATRDSINHIFSILDAEDEDQIQIKQLSQLIKKPIEGRIAFQSVDFKYQSRKEMALRNVSFQVKEGEKVNFVGPSGCGKSTIMQLLIGFYQPLKGNILIDGVLLKDYDIHHLRSCFGVVSQEPILFNETIKYNIKYNHPTATDEEIVAAAKESNYNPEDERLLQRVSSSEGKGFDINVGIRGSHLSGGQKQRVAIARTILKKPHVLLLDEATSALDPTNEQIVQDSLNRMMTGKTTINVTHRYDTIKPQQRALTFKRGKLVEDTTRQNSTFIKDHSSLSEKNK